jgi:hypothetical protein
MHSNCRYYNSWIETVEQPESVSSKSSSSPSKSPSKSMQSQFASERHTGAHRSNLMAALKFKSAEKTASGSPKSYSEKDDSVDWDSASDQDDNEDSETDKSSSDELGRNLG